MKIACARAMILGLVAWTALGLRPLYGVTPAERLHVTFPTNRPHPWAACTPEERTRLQTAWHGAGSTPTAMSGLVASAEALLKQPVEFPPRGGQHNTFYQCRKCQTGLKTIAAHHHQCPVCKTVYSGSTYDDCVYKNQHGRNLQNMTTAAWAWAITGDRRYADYAAGILLGYAGRYRNYPYHGSGNWVWNLWSGGHLYEQTLSEASALATAIGPAYDLIYDSGALAENDHDCIRAGLIRPMLKTIGKCRRGINNWQSWHNAAMMYGGVLLQDETWIRRALLDSRNGFFFQLEHSVTAEGMWYENSWGYHFYALDALVIVAETGRRLGLDLWPAPALKAMFTLPVAYTMADGQLPRFGDDVGTSLRRHPALLERAWQAYQDPLFLNLLSDQPTFDSILLERSATRTAAGLPAPRSAVFTNAGHAILRSGGTAGMTAALTFGPYGGGHGHFDKLSFVWYAFGRELAVDSGCAISQAYRLPIHRDWYKATVSHNTVVVDQRSQEPAAGACLAFAATDSAAGVAVRCWRAYPGVEHRRLFLLLPDYALVADDLSSERPHQFDWLYHHRGTSVTCAAVSSVPAGANHPAYEYIRPAGRGRTADPVRIQFGAEWGTTVLTLAAAPETEIITGDGPAGSVELRAPLAVISRTGKATTFIAVLEPAPHGQSAGAADISETACDGRRSITVQRNGKKDMIVWESNGRFTVTRDGVSLLPGA